MIHVVLTIPCQQCNPAGQWCHSKCHHSTSSNHHRHQHSLILHNRSDLSALDIYSENSILCRHRHICILKIQQSGLQSIRERKYKITFNTWSCVGSEGAQEASKHCSLEEHCFNYKKFVKIWKERVKVWNTPTHTHQLNYDVSCPKKRRKSRSKHCQAK